MMRTLLSFTFLFLLATGAQAQTETVTLQRHQQLVSEQADVFYSPAVTPAAGQVWWSNYDLLSDIDNCYGTKIAEHYDVAILVPFDVAPKGESTVDGFSFYAISNDMSNVKVWVSSTLPSADSDMLETKDVAKADIAIDEFNDVKFNGSYPIPAEGLYVGVSFDITSVSDIYSRVPIVYTSTAANRAGGLYYRTTNTVSWKSREGNAKVKVLIGGGNMAVNAVRPLDFKTNYVVKGEAVAEPVSLLNMGVGKVESISYTITTDGIVSPEITMATNIEGYESFHNVTIYFAADDQPKKHDKVLTITKVNGQPNEYAANTSTGSIITLSQRFAVTPVIESFTKMPFNGSPLTISWVNAVEKLLGDKVIPLEVHVDDILQTDGYKKFIDGSISQLPMVYLNRQFVIPSVSVALQMALSSYPTVEESLNRMVPGKVEAEAIWKSDTDIEISANATFAYDAADAKYGIAYVLVEDGLTGTGTEWNQANGYSGESGIEAMKFWYDAPSQVPDMTYNHVPVAAWSIFDGVDGSIPATVEAGQSYAHSFTASIANNSLVQDKNKLSVVALLIDRTNNQIVNATRVKEIPSGIKGVLVDDNDAAEVARYDLSGRRLNTPQKGLNIIRLANGKSVKKIED